MFATSSAILSTPIHPAYSIYQHLSFFTPGAQQVDFLKFFIFIYYIDTKYFRRKIEREEDRHLQFYFTSGGVRGLKPGSLYTVLCVFNQLCQHLTPVGWFFLFFLFYNNFCFLQFIYCIAVFEDRLSVIMLGVSCTQQLCSLGLTAFS